MRISRLTTVPELAQNRSPPYPIMHAHGDTSILQVSVGYIAVAGNSYHDIIARDVVQRDRLRQYSWCILCDSVHDLCNFSICHGMDRLAVAPPVLVVSGSVMV